MERRAKFTPQRYSPQGSRKSAWTRFLCDGTDPPGLIVKEIDKTIGKGVFAGRKFPTGSFLMEYAGELIAEKEGNKRERSYPVELGSFLLFFKDGRSLMCVDATFSTQCGRYVNDGIGEQKNAELKVVYVGTTPHVVLFACRNISKDEEIRFDYGVDDLPWRQKHRSSGLLNRDSLCHSIKECKVLLQKMDPGADTFVYNKEDGTDAEVKIITTHTELEYQTSSEKFSQSTEEHQNGDGNCKRILAMEGQSSLMESLVVQEQDDNNGADTRVQRHEGNEETVTNGRNALSKKTLSQSTEEQQNGDRNGKRILVKEGQSFQEMSLVVQEQDDSTGGDTRAQPGKGNEETVTNALLKRQTSRIKAADANVDGEEMIVHYIIIEDQDATTSTNTGGSLEIPLSNIEREEYTTQQRCVEVDLMDQENVTESTSTPSNGTPTSPTTFNSQSKKKPHRPCPYCFCYKAALTKHLVKKHGDKTEVIDALKFQKQERDRAFLLLKRKGIMMANMKKLRSTDNKPQSLIRERKRTSEVSDVIYCSKCFGFFKKSYFHRHRRDCHLNERSIYFPHAVQPEVVAIENIQEEKFSQEILGSLFNDEVGQICKTDSLIVSYAQKKFRKLLTKKNMEKYEDKKTNIRTEMRRLGNLFKAFKEICADNKLPCVSSFEMYSPGRFNILEEAIDHVTIKEDGCVKYGLRKDIGYLIKRICKFLHGKFSVEQNIENRNQVDSFLNVLTFFWSDIFGEAESALVFTRQTQLRKPSKLPKQSDVKRLRDFMRSEIQQLTESDYNFIASSDFIKLRNLVVSRLTLFNARRGGEPCCLQTNQWAEAESNAWLGEGDLDHDPVEQSLLGKYKIAYQTGKGEKLVPLLILDDCWKALKKLCDPEVRQQATVDPKNTYVFPRIQYSLKHVSGWEAVKECCNLAGLDHAINATGMRHYIATIYAGLEINESERETFYNHMGHSESINKNIYQSPPARQTITRVGRFLHGIDQDTLSHTPGEKQKGGGGRKSSLVGEGQSSQVINSKLQEEDDDTCAETSQGNDTVSNCRKDSAKNTLSHMPGEKQKGGGSGKNSLVVEGQSSQVIYSIVQEQDDGTGAETSQGNITISNCRKDSPKRGRPYMLWSVGDTNVITDYFNDYILSLQHLDTNRGSLPGVDKINIFLDQYPNILINLPRKERIHRVRTKIFNERKLAREKVRRNVNRDLLESKCKHTTANSE